MYEKDFSRYYTSNPDDKLHFYVTSCKNRAAEKQQAKAEMEQVKTIENQIEENVYPLPTSAEVIKMLTDLEVGYIIGISNPVANTKKYFSSTNRAINTGCLRSRSELCHSLQYAAAGN